MLTAIFTPTDTADYAPVTETAFINVAPALLTIEAKNVSRTYGNPNPKLTADYLGFVNGDTPASLATHVTLSTQAVPASSAGTYSILAGGATSPNYTIRYVGGTLTIVPPTKPIIRRRIAFVDSLYSELLQRPPGPSELFSRLQQLNAGMSPRSVASSVNKSPARRVALQSQNGVRVKFAAALRDALKAARQAVETTLRAHKAGHR
jgi:hypothetical protein